MRLAAALLAGVVLVLPAAAQRVTSVDLTWLSMANVYYEIGAHRILVDGYITRLPQRTFYGGGGGLANTREAFRPDVDGVRRVLTALGGPPSVTLLLTGHSHFDHSFDTATWSRLTGARILGPRTTCFQAASEDLPADRCSEVKGGERIVLSEGVTMRVIRWNHSGDSAINAEQHDPVELAAPPRKDPVNGGLRAGVAEDFPNGGGSRAFLFVVDTPGGRLSWFHQSSASAVDLHMPMTVGAERYGAPLDNLREALAAEGLDAVDLWIGTGGAAVARLVLPVLKPRAYLPVHWDGLWRAFEADAPGPFSDPALETVLATSKVQLVRPEHYLDKWRLDRSGVRAVVNEAIKQALGFRAGG